MKTFSRWLNVILIVILFPVGLFILNLMNFFSSEPQEVSAPIPADAELIVRIDAKTFWQKGAYSVVFESDNDTIIGNEIKHLIDKKFIKRQNDLLPLDVNKDIVLFKLTENGKNFMVAAIQITNKKQFERAVAKKNPKTTLGFRIDKTGYLISSNDRDVNAKDFQQIKKRIEQAKAVDFKDLGDRSNFITLKSGINSSKKKYWLGIQQTKDAFTISGEINGFPAFKPMDYEVKSSGLGITLANIDSEVNTQIREAIPFFGKNDITGISIDYQGLTISNEAHGMPSIQGILPIPTANMVLRFKDKLNLDSIYNRFPEEVRKENKTIIIEKKTYHLALLDDHHLFIGADESAVVKKPSKTYFAIKGDLNSLAKFDGSFFVVVMLSNSKPVKTFSNFAKTTSNVDFSIKQKGPDNYTVKGKLPFKEGKNSINEVVKVVLSLGLVKY